MPGQGVMHFLGDLGHPSSPSWGEQYAERPRRARSRHHFASSKSPALTISRPHAHCHPTLRPLARLVTRECAVEEVRSCRARLARRPSFGAPLLPPLPMLAVLVG